MGIGICGWLMTAVSWLLVLVTLPFSLFFCFKVSLSRSERSTGPVACIGAEVFPGGITGRGVGVGRNSKMKATRLTRPNRNLRQTSAPLNRQSPRASPVYECFWRALTHSFTHSLVALSALITVSHLHHRSSKSTSERSYSDWVGC